MDTHLEHLTKALTLLQQHQLFAKLSTCKFGCSEVEYLGHIISVEGVCADPGKIQAMVDWPLPKTTKALRGFLGLRIHSRTLNSHVAAQFFYMDRFGPRSLPSP